jgi:hypothetical protein
LSGDGFSLPNIFQEGKTPAVRTKSKGKKSKKKDSFERMERDSINQSKGMGIDQPRRDLNINTFSQDIKNAENPLNAGLKIEAGFPQPKVQPNQQRNPLNVGLQVGNLGIDTFDTKKSAFSGRVLDQGIGATPVPRSALGGAENLGGDFITQVTGKKDGKKVKGTGFGGSGEDDFLKVSGRSFAGVPQIAGREPTVAGARRAAQQTDVRDLDIAGGIDSLAGGIGRTAQGVLLREKGQKKFRKQTVKAFQENKGIRKIKEKIPTEDPILSGIGKIRKKRKAKQFAQKGFDEDEAREEQEIRERLQQRSNIEGRARQQAEEEALRRELSKRQLTTRTGVSDDPELDDLRKRESAKVSPQADRRPKALPFSKEFDKDGDGDIDSIGQGIPKGVFGQKPRDETPTRQPFPAVVEVTEKPDIGSFSTKKEQERTKPKTKKKIKKRAK